MSSAVEIDSVHKSFPGHWGKGGVYAVKGVSLQIPQGGVYGLIGPNGSGKSTIIRHIMGIYRQDSGEVLIDGQPVYENAEVKGKIAYIPDDVFYFQQAGVRDMMQYYRGIYPNFDTERYEKLRRSFSSTKKCPSAG